MGKADEVLRKYLAGLTQEEIKSVGATCKTNYWNITGVHRIISKDDRCIILDTGHFLRLDQIYDINVKYLPVT